MGYMIHSLASLPVQKGVTLYIFVINGQFRDRYFEALERCFPQIASEIGDESAIVRGLTDAFTKDVCLHYLGKRPQEMYDLLPALLVTDARLRTSTKARPAL
jgi:hypothetical protein